MHHKEQQREDEEGRDAADDEPHPAGHGVKKAVSICQKKQEIRKEAASFSSTHLLQFFFFFPTWIQASKLAALFWIFAKVLTPLRTLAQRRHAHLRLAIVTGAAQTGVVALRREVVALVYHVVLYVDAGLPCRKERRRQQRAEDAGAGGDEERARTALAEKGELLVAVLGVPAVETPFVHALDLKALQLGTEDAVLAGGGLPKVCQALGRQENLHRSCSKIQISTQSSRRAAVYAQTWRLVKQRHLGRPPPNDPPGNGSDW